MWNISISSYYIISNKNLFAHTRTHAQTHTHRSENLFVFLQKKELQKKIVSSISLLFSFSFSVCFTTCKSVRFHFILTLWLLQSNDNEHSTFVYVISKSEKKKKKKKRNETNFANERKRKPSSTISNDCNSRKFASSGAASICNCVKCCYLRFTSGVNKNPICRLYLRIMHENNPSHNVVLISHKIGTHAHGCWWRWRWRWCLSIDGWMDRDGDVLGWCFANCVCYFFRSLVVCLLLPFFTTFGPTTLSIWCVIPLKANRHHE